MRSILILGFLSVTTSIDAATVSCSYAMRSRTILGSVYDCTASSTVTTPNDTVTAFTGTHSPSTKNDESVQYLYFVSLTINYVPHGIANFYTNLEGLEIYSCKLMAIEKVDIEHLTKLKSLQLYHNNIETLKSNLFDDNKELMYVNFQSNKLKFIGYDILKTLTKLTHVYFSSNTCISKDVSTAAEIENIKKDMNDKCLTEEDMKIKYCQKDFDANNAEITTLKAENAKAKAEIKKLKEALTQAVHQLTATDGNLNSATKNLYVIKKHVQEIDDLNDELSGDVDCNTATPDKKAFTALEDTKLVCTDLKESTVCEAYVLNVKYPETKIQVTDQSHNVISSSDMETLTVIDQQTLFLPNNLADRFPKLTEMSVVRSGLFEIDPNILEGMFNLKTLNFTENKLREVKSDTFKDQTDLTKLDLSFNKIEIVNQGAFNGPTNLKTLLLNDNLLIRIDGRATETLMKLQVLTLHNNILKYISPNLLSAFDELTSADLTNNKCVDMSFPESSLDDIETKLTNNCVAPIDFNCNFRVIKDLVDGSSSYMCSPQKLIIINPKTRISSLKGKNVDGFGFNDVTTLMISDQTAEYLPFEMAKTFTKLERIIVEKSKLVKLQAKDFEGVKSLKTIVILGNKIKSIHSETFVDVPQLDHLDLSGNEIKDLPSGVFASLTKMRTLKMSNNDLEKLNANAIARKNQIEKFLFNSNQLEFIDLKVLKLLRKATVIDFSDNECIDEKFVDGNKESKKMAELFGDIALKCTLDE